MALEGGFSQALGENPHPQGETPPRSGYLGEAGKPPPPERFGLSPPWRTRKMKTNKLILMYM